MIPFKDMGYRTIDEYRQDQGRLAQRNYILNHGSFREKVVLIYEIYSPKVRDQFSAAVETLKSYAWQSLEKVSNSLKISSLKFSEGSLLNSVVSLFKQTYPTPEEVPARLFQQPAFDFGFEEENPQPEMAVQQEAPIVEFAEPMGYEEIAAPILEQPIQKRVVKQRRRVEPTMPKRVQPDRTAKAKISPNFYAVRTYREMDQFMQRNRASRYN